MNSIKIIKDQSVNHGKLLITVGESAFSTSEIIVDAKDIHSIVSIGTDDDHDDGNVLRITRFHANGEWHDQERALTLPGDAFRDRQFIDYLLSDKEGESDLTNDFNDLMIKQNELATKFGKIGAFDVLTARDTVSLTQDTDKVIEAQIQSGSQEIESNLNRLAEIYGAENLKNMSDREMYGLYKTHAVTGK